MRMLFTGDVLLLKKFKFIEPKELILCNVFLFHFPEFVYFQLS